MENQKLTEIKKSLLNEKERVEKELSEVAEKKGEKFVPIYPEYGDGDEENASEAEEYEVHLALDKNLEKILTDVIKALAKIEAGTYGKCDSCGQEIPAERLEAFPSALLCVPCQSKKENPFNKFFRKLNPHKNVKQPKK